MQVLQTVTFPMFLDSNHECILPSWHNGVQVFPHADVLRDVGIVVTWYSRRRVIGLADGEEERGVVTGG